MSHGAPGDRIVPTMSIVKTEERSTPVFLAGESDWIWKSPLVASTKPGLVPVKFVLMIVPLFVRRVLSAGGVFGFFLKKFFFVGVFDGVLYFILGSDFVLNVFFLIIWVVSAGINV